MTNREVADALAAIVKDLRSSRFHICPSCGVSDEEYAERAGAQATATECADKLAPLLTALRAAPEGDIGRSMTDEPTQAGKTARRCRTRPACGSRCARPWTLRPTSSSQARRAVSTVNYTRG